MNATSIPGVWSYELRTGGVMLINTNENYIRVKPMNRNAIEYHFLDEITISDFQTVRNEHELSN